jgi:hypothetical protein
MAGSRATFVGLRTHDPHIRPRTPYRLWPPYGNTRSSSFLFRFGGLVGFSDFRCALSFCLFLSLACNFFLSAALLIFNGALLCFLAEPGFFDFPLTLLDVFPLARL